MREPLGRKPGPHLGFTMTQHLYVYKLYSISIKRH